LILDENVQPEGGKEGGEVKDINQRDDRSGGPKKDEHRGKAQGKCNPGGKTVSGEDLLVWETSGSDSRGKGEVGNRN